MKFLVKVQSYITTKLRLFEFISNGGKIVLDNLKDVRHIGQYFTMEAFGKTRLYSCVLSMTRKNRTLCKKIIDSKIKSKNIIMP